MYYNNGDILLHPIGKAEHFKVTQLGKGKTSSAYYPCGYVIIADENIGHELIGVAKGDRTSMLRARIKL
jgi:hypothetical protein